MKNLTFNYWNYFYDSQEEKFDGIKFENLVAELLSCEYPNYTWERTQPSWDGKKDFYTQHISGDNELIEWAECKIYQKNLSINVISSTLIMSTLNNINSVIFFSYSQFNKNAIEILSQFSEEHNLTIISYDDEKLEDLIFKHKNKINFSKFFPDYLDNPRILSSGISVSEKVFIYSKNYAYTLEEIKRKEIKVNEVFDLIITLENKSLESAAISIFLNLKQGELYKYFELANKQLTICEEIILSPCEITSYILHVKLIKFKKTIVLPKILVSYNEQQIEFVSHFNGSWLAEIPLIGYNNLLKIAIGDIDDDYYFVGYVHGTSGIGKSRFLQEIHKNNLLLGIKSHYINVIQSGKSSRWIKLLFSEYYNLPLLSLKKSELEDHQLNWFGSSEEQSIVMDVLYNDEFNLESNSISIAKIILKILSSEKRVLLLDNIQDLDKDSIMIINEIINNIDTPGEINIVVSVNSDYVLLNSEIYNLCDRLRSLCKDDKQHYKRIHLKGLKGNQPRIFISACFGNHISQSINESQYDEYINTIATTAQNNPLFIEQVLIHLCSEGVIFVNDDHFSIFDNASFKKCLNELPASLDDYFEKRYTKLSRKYPSMIKNIDFLLRILCFFEHISYDLQLEIDLDDSIISILEKFGIIKINNGIEFYHQLLRRYFKKRFPSLKIKEFKKCKKAILDCNLKHVYKAHYYYCVLKTTKISDKNLRESISALLDRDFPKSMVSDYCELLFQKTDNLNISYDNDELTKQTIKFLTKYCYYVRDNISYDDGLKKYCEFYYRFIMKSDKLKLFGEEVYDFIRYFLNISLTLHLNKKVIEIGELALSHIKEYRFESDSAKEKAESMLYNRMHIAYYRLQHSVNSDYLTIAKQYIKKSMRIAKKIQNTFYIIQNEIDYGYLFYSNHSSKAKTILHWEKAYNLLNELKNSQSWNYGVYYHNALLAAMNSRYSDSVHWITEVEKIYRRELATPYYYNKACLLNAIVSFLNGTCNKKILERIVFAENRCQKNNFKLGFPICSHLKAIYYHKYDYDLGKATMYYKKSIFQYYEKWTSSELDLHRNFFLDLIHTLYMINNTVELDERIVHYYNENISEHIVFKSYIYDKKTKTNFPCI